MRKTIILGLAVTGFALIPLTASADSNDSKYPAANFEPKVIYIDKEAADKLDSASEKPAKKKAQFDPKYPAAYFEPKIIFP